MQSTGHGATRVVPTRVVPHLHSLLRPSILLAHLEWPQHTLAVKVPCGQHRGNTQRCQRISLAELHSRAQFHTVGTICSQTLPCLLDLVAEHPYGQPLVTPLYIVV